MAREIERHRIANGRDVPVKIGRGKGSVSDNEREIRRVERTVKGFAKREDRA